MPDELIDICDENNKLLGIRRLKSVAHRDGLWHRAAHIWIYNSRGEILLQLRAKQKPLYPNQWDISAAGHVSAGENVITSGLREVDEEIGLKIKSTDLEFLMIKKDSSVFREIKNNEFFYVFLYKYNGPAHSLRLQTEEVQKIKFLSPEEITRDLVSNPDKYVPHEGYWQLILEVISKRILRETKKNTDK